MKTFIDGSKMSVNATFYSTSNTRFNLQNENDEKQITDFGFLFVRAIII